MVCVLDIRLFPIVIFTLAIIRHCFGPVPYGGPTGDHATLRARAGLRGAAPAALYSMPLVGGDIRTTIPKILMGEIDHEGGRSVAELCLAGEVVKWRTGGGACSSP